MTGPSGTLPFSRPVQVTALPAGGRDHTVEADEAERAAVAKALGLVAVERLTGRFRLHPQGAAVEVDGTVSAQLTQTCSVTLDPFEHEIEEPVDLVFMPESGFEAWMSKHRPDPSEDLAYEIDPPDLVVDGRIDLGKVTTEFLSLGLDPYPRKPGVTFETRATEAEKDPSPFAALAQWKNRE